MARQIIDIDTVQPNGKKGDPARLMSQKVNGNFEELYGSVSGLAAVGGDNMLINCGVPINQRGFAGGALAAGAYGYDRWKAGTGGCNVTINATTGVFTHTSGPLQQIVEAPQLAWGQPLTISVENPSGSISVSVGGATGTITAGSGRRGVTLTPSGSGNLTVQLTASGVTYARPKLERGSAASPFVVRPQALEVALCQRYYQKSYNLATTPGTVTNEGRVTWGSGNLTNSLNRAYVTFKCVMRAPPAVVLRGAPSGATGVISQADGTNVAASPEAIGETGFNAAWSNTNGQWGGWWHWTADSEI